MGLGQAVAKWYTHYLSNRRLYYLPPPLGEVSRLGVISGYSDLSKVKEAFIVGKPYIGHSAIVCELYETEGSIGIDSAWIMSPDGTRRRLMPQEISDIFKDFSLFKRDKYEATLVRGQMQKTLLEYLGKHDNPLPTSKPLSLQRSSQSF